MERVKIYASQIEETAVEQINTLQNCGAYKDSIIRIMPDCHAGKGCTIGTVLSITDKIIPNTVGVDIGCGIIAAQIHEGEIDVKLLDQVINDLIPSGFSIRSTPLSERFYRIKLNELKCKEIIDIDNALLSIGTLGGGNHFIEAAVDSQGKYWLIVHTGSRHLGVTIAQHYQKKAEVYCSQFPDKRNQLIQSLKEQGRTSEIEQALQQFKKENPSIPKELSYLGDPKDMEDYLHDMAICQQYASSNRWQIVNIITEALGLYWRDYIDTRHNYIDIRTNILRKGAVSAMNGEWLVIPMNMKEGTLICKGKGNIDWLYSAPHGAGRIMSRQKAKDTLSMEDFKEDMKDIYSTSVCEETIDESPRAYKNAEEIKELIKPTVDIVDVLKPIYNFKAKSS